MSGSRVVEYANRNRLSELLLQDVFGVFVPLIDSGIDMIAYREDTREIRLIQQKSRWTVDRKYLGRNIWIAFPDGEDWFLVPHDHLLRTAHEGLVDTQSWTETGVYSRASITAAQRSALAGYKIGVSS
ncbi:hypothetical protein [Jannaschia formosa]|uniref:hypothetical protein n=1 Tax=Jannaschia formosa TaxID=2259592 RepID=UPI000E1BD5EF|nr:hypothetical protein [Jannaschia formosa]TFL18152.1 hypothetical protein DR046_10365 [Jannaschia formosa]